MAVIHDHVLCKVCIFGPYDRIKNRSCQGAVDAVVRRLAAVDLHFCRVRGECGSHRSICIHGDAARTAGAAVIPAPTAEAGVGAGGGQGNGVTKIKGYRCATVAAAGVIGAAAVLAGNGAVAGDADGESGCGRNVTKQAGPRAGTSRSGD